MISLKNRNDHRYMPKETEKNYLTATLSDDGKVIIDAGTPKRALAIYQHLNNCSHAGVKGSQLFGGGANRWDSYALISILEYAELVTHETADTIRRQIDEQDKDKTAPNWEAETAGAKERLREHKKKYRDAMGITSRSRGG